MEGFKTIADQALNRFKKKDTDSRNKSFIKRYFRGPTDEFLVEKINYLRFNI